MKTFLLLALLGLVVVIVAVNRLHKRELSLFSPVTITVTKNGQPIPFAEVKQDARFTWKNETREQVAQTDEQGTALLPEVKSHAILAHLLPHQPNIRQTILIKHEGVEYLGWAYDKSDYYSLSELNGKTIKLICELTNEKGHLLKAVDTTPDGPYGICRLK